MQGIAPRRPSYQPPPPVLSWRPPGLFWWQRGGRGNNNTLSAAADVVGLLFFELLFPAFQALFSALFLFPAGAPPPPALPCGRHT